MKKFLALAMSMSSMGAALAGCGSSQDASASVSTNGSTSMEKVINTLGEAFVQNNKNAKFTYNPTGSGSGITAASMISTPFRAHNVRMILPMSAEICL